MASNKGQGRNPGRRRRALPDHLKPQAMGMEWLERRTLMSTTPTPGSTYDPQSGPLAKAGPQLIQAVQAFNETYLKQGKTIGFVDSGNAPLANLLNYQGSTVEVDVRATADTAQSTLNATLAVAGMTVTANDPSLHIAEGYLPLTLANFEAVTTNRAIVSVDAAYKPIPDAATVNPPVSGAAPNESDQTLYADVARQIYHVTGAGVKVGALSDSVDQYPTAGVGLAPTGPNSSVASGDLPPNVQVLQDGPAGSEDEGRAMLEQIHDIAPGASLAFNTASGGEVAFAQGIQNLAAAGSNVIVDDIKYLDEPYYQDGIVGRAVDGVVAQGVTYFSSSGNRGPSGYESQFRPVTANIPGITTGMNTFMNFNPNGGAPVTGMPITVTAPSAGIAFQYDDPYYSTVAHDLRIYLLDSAGNVVAADTTNHLQTNMPFSILTAPITAANPTGQIQPGNYQVAIQLFANATTTVPVVSTVGHVFFFSITNNNTITINQGLFGNAGGTFYPTTFGHADSASAIGVGALGFWDGGPFGNQNVNEPYSSSGPVVHVYAPDGTRLAAPQLLLKPDVTGPDANNTSFFVPGQFINTATANPGLGPPSAVNYSDPNFPNFTGTSSAAPNLAAVAALMKQLNPLSTPAQVKAAMIGSGTPLNGAAQGAFDAQGGFGLVNAVSALNSISALMITATNPANASTLSIAPTAVDVTFNKAVNAASLSASDLLITRRPAGVTVKVGAPILLAPNIVRFPLTITPASLQSTLNGGYQFAIAAGSVSSADGQILQQGDTVAFNVADIIPPRVTNVITAGRYVVISFDKSLRASTVNKGTVGLLRNGVDVALDPRASVFYSTLSNQIIIDLSGLDQGSLTSADYAVQVNNTVTDVAGNPLDGAFNGSFPSGNGQGGTTFFDNLGFINLSAPVVTSLVLDPASESGVAGSNNTKVLRPVFDGTVSTGFPGQQAGLTVAVQFTGPRGDLPDLSVGPNGRGFVGNPDLLVTTDASGHFTFQAPFNLPDGLQSVRIVVVGQSEISGTAGLSSQTDLSFRIDTTTPLVSGASIPYGGRVAALPGISLFAVDVVNPSQPGNPLAVPTQLDFPALDPATADNVSNYALFKLGPSGNPNAADKVDESSFIVAANYVSTTARAQTGDPYTGRVDLTFAPGLPTGQYFLAAKGKGGNSFNSPRLMAAPGITDAAGNPLDEYPNLPGIQSYGTVINLQTTPVFVTAYNTFSTNSDGTMALHGPRAYYEVPSRGVAPRADAPPFAVVIDFSASLDPLTISNGTIQLLRSATGDFTGAAGSDVSVVPGTTVTLASTRPGSVLGQPGFDDRLILNLPANTTLGPDHYRLSIPNDGATALRDVFGNQLDGEFLGTQNAQGAYQDLIVATGQTRAGLSGDGVVGGSFQTGFVVVPTGNIIYARPDYNVDLYNLATAPDGSLARPFPVLAPQAAPTALNGGDLNDITTNRGTNFDPNQDRAQRGQFEPSAFFAAQQAAKLGPVVIIALPAQNAPVTSPNGTYVLDLPPKATSTNSVLSGSASVPFNTTLVFDPGTVVRLFNASLFAQNQGSAIQAMGSASNPVVFTSFNDPRYGGGNPSQGPTGGDWGGVVFRNFDQGGLPSNLQRQIDTQTTDRNATNVTFTTRPDQFPVDGTLQGPNGTPARSGEDDGMSILNFSNLNYGGGPVPQTQGTLGTGYDSVELFNSRPTLSNLTINNSGATSVTPGATVNQAAIGADFDSFREDALARGPLMRNINFFNDSINGVLLRAEPNGAIEMTDALHYPNNAFTAGGDQNFTFASPVPYVDLSLFRLGTQYLFDSSNQEVVASNRTYIQPGSLFKFERGAGIDVDPLDGSSRYWTDLATGNLTASPIDRPTSLNVGDRNYFTGFDQSGFYSPLNADGSVNPSFVPEAAGDAQVLFTSFYDSNATTSFVDPVTGRVKTIVPANDTANLTAGGTRPQPAGFVPTPGSVPNISRWGSISVRSGVQAVINAATVQYAGGTINTPGSSIAQRAALTFQDASAIVTGGFFAGNTRVGGTGTHVMVTNDNFFDNTDVPMNFAEPDGILAADPLRPLLTGNPYFRGNVMQRNGINGLGVTAGELDVNSVWDSTDLTYIVRGTIFLSGYDDPISPYRPAPPVPSATQFQAELTPVTTLTVQDLLPDSLLADGTHIAVPGEQTLIKLQGGAPGLDANIVANVGASTNAGAGFIVGVDNGVDPPADSLIDPGWGSQIRILGIPGNESIGQPRVPVTITSIHDDSVGTTVRGVTMNQAITGNAQAPAAGDGGLIYFGGNSLYTYNLYDLREGNRIDNADLKYMSRVEAQNGGIYESLSPAANPLGELQGVTPGTQFNASSANAITDSNLSNFRDVGVYEHPGFQSITFPIAGVGPLPPGVPTRLGGAIQHASGVLFMVNDTVSNAPIGVEINGETVLPNNVFQAATNAILLNNDFYNDNVGVDGNTAKQGAVGSLLAMDNIFDNTPGGSIIAPFSFVGGGVNPNFTGGINGFVLGNVQSLAQYNLFFQAPTPTGTIDNEPNPQITGDPLFVNPGAGNFNLNEFGANGVPSAAIDAARSELGPGYYGGLLTPIATQVRDPNDPNQLTASGVSIRNATNRNGNDFVALPGLPGRSFFDEFVATLSTQSANGARQGPAGNIATYFYAPAAGQRDQRGFLRQDDPNVPNVGFGAQPFFDIGAFEFRQFFPPHVTGVTAVTSATSPTGANIYVVGGIGGINKTPTSIDLSFDKRLDPTTINAQDVLLERSNGTGLFTVPPATFINLAGKLSFSDVTNTLVIDTSGLNLGNDEYRVILKGTGSNVIRDLQGNALAGLNLDANGAQLPLTPPAAGNTPGSDFQATFTIDTHPPAIVPGSFMLAPSSDSSGGLGITNINTPTFIGTITDVFPPANPLLGQNVLLQVSPKGNGVYETVGLATTAANGTFSVTSTVALPDSPYNVGPDGRLAPPPFTLDNTGYSFARVIVIDQAGNVSNINDINAYKGFYVDTAAPRVLSTSPTSGAVAPSPNGVVNISLTVNKNINPATLNAGSISVVGPTGAAVAVDPASITVTPIKIAGDIKGPERISFNITGATANGNYAVTLSTAAGTAVTDFAGNPLVSGGNFVIPFLVLNPANTRIIYVNGAAATTNPNAPAPTGTRANPFTTIAAGLAAANIGDTVAVLPGVYGETVTLKNLVRLVSADPTSTSAAVVPGNALQTVIRPSLAGAQGTLGVFGQNLTSLPGFPTELSGFTIDNEFISPAGISSVAAGTTGALLFNSDATIDKNYFILAKVGLGVVPVSGGGQNSLIENNVFAGDGTGTSINATGNATASSPVRFYNNTVAFNHVGLQNLSNPSPSRSTNTVDVGDNIFFQNDRQQVGGGNAILATGINTTEVRYNLFFGNAGGSSSPANATSGIGNGFNPAALGATPDRYGNLSGNPAFKFAVDPRPQFNGPATFFLDANFDINSNSAALDRALASISPPDDLLSRSRLMDPDLGGPTDMGAFEFQGAGSPSTGTTVISGGTPARTPVVTPANNSGGFTQSTTPPYSIPATPAPAPNPTSNRPSRVPRIQVNAAHPHANLAAAHAQALAARQARLQAAAAAHAKLLAARHAKRH